MRFQYLMFSLVLIMVMSLASAISTDFKASYNEKLNIQKPCTVGGMPSASAYANMTIVYSNGTIFLPLTGMTSSYPSPNFNVLITAPSFTDTLTATWYCYVNGLNNSESFYIDVTPTGTSIDVSKAILYSLTWVFFVAIFVGLIIVGVTIPYGNESDQLTGYLIAVSNKKYIKILAWLFAYLVLLCICYLSYQISYGFLELVLVSSLFDIAWKTLAWGTLIAFPLVIYFMIANAVRDSQLGDQLSRGFRVR